MYAWKFFQVYTLHLISMSSRLKAKGSLQILQNMKTVKKL